MAVNMVSRLLRKQYVPLRIRLEVLQKGIEQDVADKTISCCNADWFQMVSDCRQKKFSDQRPTETNEKIRQLRYLQSRRFSMDMINEAMTSQED